MYGNKLMDILHLINQRNANQACNKIIYHMALIDKLTKSHNPNSEDQ